MSVQEGRKICLMFPYIEFTFSLSPLLQINLLWWIWIRDQRPKHIIIQLLCGGGVLGKPLADWHSSQGDGNSQ